jgi:Coenzyme PQQ synthesis protein D (PqqD)
MPGDATTASAPTARSDLVFRALDDEWVLYDPRDEQLHVLNRVSAVIWLCCDGRGTVADIVDAVMAEFDGDVARSKVADDVSRTLEGFAKRGLFV